MVDKEKAYIVFSSVVMSIAAKKFNAGTSHEEAAPFVRQLFEIYLASDLDYPTIDWIGAPPKKTKAWIASELSNRFKVYGSQPRWIDEPYWRYLGNAPMDFAHQFEVEAGGGENIYSGLMTYVFFGHQALEGGGCELVIKLVQQTKGEPGTVVVK